MADWKSQLNDLLGSKHESRAEKEEIAFRDFLDKTVLPAFGKLQEELSKYGRGAIVRETRASATLIVKRGDEEEISFCVLRRSLPTGIVPYAEIRARERMGLRVTKSEASLHGDATSSYNVDDVTQDDVINVFLRNYTASLAEPGA